jgi:ATP-dependent Clp protease ATP-binding subunit ClpA
MANIVPDPGQTEAGAGTISEQAFLADPATSRWVKDIFRFLPLKSEFVLHGNIRDQQPFPRGNGRYARLSLPEYLCEALSLRGYQHFLVFRNTEGFSVLAPPGKSLTSEREFFNTTFKIKFDEGERAHCDSFSGALDVIEQLANSKDHAIAVFADFASRYILNLESLNEDEHRNFTRALLLSHSVVPRLGTAYPVPQFNPLFWLCDKENDLPGWFTFSNSRIRQLAVPRPDHVVRRALIPTLMDTLEGATAASQEQRQEVREHFVEQTEGMPLADVIAITQLCRHEKLPFQDIGEAVRRYKLGVTDDPWKKLDHDVIANGEDRLRERVKGQSKAVTKALDIIKRAVTGLSGAQGAKSGGRPRGVLFLAGPTGTGKTELAKALTELLFGDERAYVRFDMSEFSAEHADQRLLGAPPGYVGYDAGGELTNAVKERPFSVILFDEIEKAHPRLLDKFLQLLDDGVLTSGRGERVYFSETIIIFTSNLGIYKQDDRGNRVLNVSADASYEQVEEKVREEIRCYFHYQLGRPEILNRIGENIVVFDFIRSEVAAQIYEKMLHNVLARLLDSRKIAVTIPETVNQQLRERCTRDLSNGGRGVGNQLEVWLINPLARALFNHGVKDGATISVVAFEEGTSGPSVKLSGSGLIDNEKK